MSSLLLVGCGKMGGALLSGWVRAQVPISSYIIIEPESRFVLETKIIRYDNLDALPDHATPDVVVFAVKPQQLAGILPVYQKRFGSKPLYISIAAGKNLAFFAEYLGANAKMVRAMPNTPALTGEGMTTLSTAPTLPLSDRKMAAQLMEGVGKVLWLDESLMDAVTAISGSGPAYVFLFMEALTKAGIAAGLGKEDALLLAVQTCVGSVHLASDVLTIDSLDTLRKNVTSPGGTTEAALKVLMKDDALEKLVREAVLAAKKRSEELK